MNTQNDNLMDHTPFPAGILRVIRRNGTVTDYNPIGLWSP